MVYIKPYMEDCQIMNDKIYSDFIDWVGKTWWELPEGYDVLRENFIEPKLGCCDQISSLISSVQDLVNALCANPSAAPTPPVAPLGGGMLSVIPPAKGGNKGVEHSQRELLAAMRTPSGRGDAGRCWRGGGSPREF